MLTNYINRRHRKKYKTRTNDTSESTFFSGFDTAKAIEELRRDGLVRGLKLEKSIVEEILKQCSQATF